jgi:D-amino-acid dehydrogenase
MNESKHVAVIGGGVIGAACAHYLSEAGCRVTILDRGRFGRGCSHANCGFVCPSHVLPLAAPGAIRNALRAMLARQSPFKIRPGFRIGLWRWLFAFARRCNVADMMESARGIQPLLLSSRTLYEDLIRGGLDCEWQTRGLLFVFHSKAAMEHYATTDELLRKEFNTPARPFFGDEVHEFEPTLKRGLGGGWLYEGDAHLRPDRLMTAWRRSLESRGVSVREDCPVRGFAHKGGIATAVQTPQGDLEADAFVLAAGAWTPMIGSVLGCRIPIQPGKGYSITTARPARCPRVPLIFEEHRVAVTPMASGYRLGSMMEFVGYNESIHSRRIDYLKLAAAQYLDQPIGEAVEETWFGWRPMTPDSRPIIGRSPALSNVVIAAGHNMLGLSMAPATGKLVMEILLGRQPHLDIGPYSPGRF